MKKSIILFGGLLFLTTQSCDVLDKEPLDSISTQQYFANANAQALEPVSYTHLTLPTNSRV